MIKLRIILQIHIPPLSPRLIPIEGTVIVDSLQGQVHMFFPPAQHIQLFLHTTGPPSNCFWFAFTKKPKIKTTVDVNVGLSESFGMVNVPRLAKLVKVLIKHEICDILV